MLELKKLEINRLIKEYEYIKSDYEYKLEVLKEADTDFLKNIDSILNKSNELKTIYHQKVDKPFININQSLEDEDIEIESHSYKKVEEPNKIKSLYRQIAKVTHPDKISQTTLNGIYLEASNYYENNDIVGIYKICNELCIPYEISESDIKIVKDSISDIQEKISFLESTFTWKWYNEEESNKNKIILKYIRNQIIGTKN